MTTTEAIPSRAWLAELDDYAATKGYRPLPLTMQTGNAHWAADYQAGKTPQAALDEAEADGLAFGADYLDPSKPV